MLPPAIVRNHPTLFLVSLMAVSFAGLSLLPPIPQDPHYHEFADQRTLLTIPNFWNVVSNLPFVLVGGAGLRKFRHDPIPAMLFLGILLTGFGSAYYHWYPNDDTLFWDRLPMTLVFMAIFRRSSRSAYPPRRERSCYGRYSQLAFSVFCCGVGQEICGSMSGRNSSPCSYCQSFSYCSHRSTPAHHTGSSQSGFMHSPNYWNSMTTRSIRPALL